jgi:2'-5' RNA ligase
VSGVRCFVGIPLPACVAEPVGRAAEAIRETDAAWRGEKWVREENLHVTLKFLGNLPEAESASLAEAVEDAVERHASFELALAGIHPIPQARRCRMLWLAFHDPNGACAALAECVSRVARAYGIDSDERPFSPHATLCRARRPKPVSRQALEVAENVLSSAPAAMSVPSVTVFTSRLTPRGPIYSPIGSRSLGGD